MEKYLVFYDTKNCITTITKCRVIDINKWGYFEVAYLDKCGITHRDNIFDNLEQARKYVGQANKIEIGV